MKKNKPLIKKANIFLWHVLGSLLIVYYRLFMCKFKSTKMKYRKKSLILSTHQSYYDFITIPYLTFPHRGSIVSTSYWFRMKKLAKLLNSLGVIKKDQYKSDISAIRQMSYVLKQGGIIYLFPEGQMTLDGRTQQLVPGVEKFIKRYKPNVYTVKANGAYLLWPKWSFKRSSGVIDCDVKFLFKEEEIDNYSEKEILEALKKELLHNDVEWLENNPNYIFRNKTKAEGIQNLAYICPKCHNKFSIYGEKSTIKCNCCDFEVTFNKNNYSFEENQYFGNFIDLFDYQKNYLKNEILKGNVLRNKAKVTYYEKVDENELGDYEVVMDLKTITFIGKDTFSFELKKILNFVITMGKSFEVPVPERTYRIYPENPKASICYKLLLDIEKEMEEKNEIVD